MEYIKSLPLREEANIIISLRSKGKIDYVVHFFFCFPIIICESQIWAKRQGSTVVNRFQSCSVSSKQELWVRNAREQMGCPELALTVSALQTRCVVMVGVAKAHWQESPSFTAKPQSFKFNIQGRQPWGESLWCMSWGCTTAAFET